MISIKGIMLKIDHFRRWDAGELLRERRQSHVLFRILTREERAFNKDISKCHHHLSSGRHRGSEA